MTRPALRGTPPPWTGSWLTAVAAAALAACSLAVDTSGLDSEPCPPDEEKLCGGVCVTIASPTYGCAAETCAPCALASVLSHSCTSDGACEVVSCAVGWADCNGVDEDGCESFLTGDPDHCGSCERSCIAELADVSTAVCVGGVCQPETCELGYGDCNRAAEDGCEQRLDAAEHCGACNEPCDDDAICEGGRCVPS